MKPTLIVLLMCTMTWAAPQALPNEEIINDQRMNLADLKKTEDVMIDDDGNFTVRFINEDGTTVQEEGIVMDNTSTGTFRVIVTKGYYSYTGDDGVPVELVYDANNPGEIVLDE